jgi:hypothetical protein
MAGVRGEAWYTEGLRFECTQCGDCCTGAEGYVWVNQAEIDAMSARLGMDSKVFEEQFVRRIYRDASRKSLIRALHHVFYTV